MDPRIFARDRTPLRGQKLSLHYARRRAGFTLTLRSLFTRNAYTLSAAARIHSHCCASGAGGGEAEGSRAIARCALARSRGTGSFGPPSFTRGEAR